MPPTVILQNELNLSTIPDEQQFQTWLDAVFQHIKNSGRENTTEVCIRIVDKAESASLNTNFRKKSGPTNVLSFPTEEDHYEISLGDIAICAALVMSEAQEQNIPVKNHWAHLTIHGILHLLGYDHIHDKDAEAMENLEIQILKTLDIDNPYTPF